MRRILLFLLLSSIMLSLCAADIYKSNELGQKLDLSQKLGLEGYYLEASEEKQTLYKNGEVYWFLETQISGSSKTITKTYADGTEQVLRYEDGLLKELHTPQTSTIFNYIDKKLAFCVVDGKEVYFLRSSSDGTLIAIKRDSELQLMGDSYLYENGQFFNLVSSSLIFTGNYETLEDGSFKVLDDQITYHYSALGYLLTISSDSQTIQYEYEDNEDGTRSIKSITTTKQDGSYTVDNYEKGIKTSSTEYDEKGLISSFTDYSSAKLVRTVYKDGRPVADIYYKEDNITVENIKYR